MEISSQQGTAAVSFMPHNNDGTRGNVVLESTLCSRCNYLELGKFRRGDVDAVYGRLATITMSSLNEQCSLCRQFRTVLDIANVWEAPSTAYTQFDLSRYVFDALISRRGSFYGHYLGIRFEQEPRTVRLFPTHGVLRGSVSDNVIPMARALETSVISFEMIVETLRVCRSSHDGTCQPTPPMTEVLRLIDCKRRLIIPAASGQPYVCLSYVWGRQAAVEQAYGSKLPEHLPKTVEDAMFIAINLGVPFLWVDRYCINQSNHEEKHDIIQNMDRIYKGAELTIIAAVGVDPNHGIPGIRGTPRKPQYRLAGENTTFVAAEEVAAEITQSKWASRGWTYQELLLSCRRLVFTSTQMYFQCGNDIGLESLVPELTSGVHGNTYRAFPREIDAKYPEVIYERFREYYQRQLSYKADTINAILGCINDLNVEAEALGDSVSHFYGVPIFYTLSDSDREVYTMTRINFIRDLLWTTITNGRYDQYATDIFPSWSWASAKANQPADTIDKLIFWNKLVGGERLQDHDGVEILVCHKLKGRINIRNFPQHQEGYKAFYPQLEVTTWTRSCDVRKDSPLRGSIHLAEQLIIRDASALEKGTVYAICLATPNFDLEHRISNISGLLVVETEPGSYRRIDVFSVQIDLADQHLSAEAALELHRAHERGEHSYQELKKNEWTGPQMLSKLPGKDWQKRTMRLV